MMADEPEDSVYEDSVEDSEESSLLQVVQYDDYALRGLRLFMNNVEGVAQDREDILEETEDMEEEPPKPEVAYITQKLTEQGVTMEDLVKILLRDHDEYDAEDRDFNQVDEEVWAKMRIIIDNYEEPQDEPRGINTLNINETTGYETPQPVVAEEQIHPNVTVRPKRHRTGIAENLNLVARELDNEW
jgi:hypothetical protein